MFGKIIYFAFSLIIMAGLFLSCADRQGPSQGYESGTEALTPLYRSDVQTIDKAVASEIKKDYYEQFQKLTKVDPKDVPISEEGLAIIYYSGNYSGCEVFYISDGLDDTQAERYVEVADYVLQFGSSRILWVYQDHKFYTIKEAYDLGLISKDDVFAIGTKIGFRQD